MQEIIEIAIAFDENYIIPCYVLLTSLFLNHKQALLRLHVIATGLSQEQKDKMQRYAIQNNSSLSFYTLTPEMAAGLVQPGNSWLTMATYYRVFFPVLVPPDVKKLIYVDTDAIVIKNLSELYNADTNGKPIAAVQEILGEVRPELNIYDRFNYFNAGVMLMNLEEWRKQQVTEKTVAFIRSFPGKLQCADQDALNVTLQNNWYSIPRKFNVMFQDIPKRFINKKHKEFLKDKVIIHYSMGAHKPWLGLNRNSFRYLYHDYLRKSPFSTQKKYIDFKYTPSYLLSFFKIRMRENFGGYYKLVPAIKKATAAIFFFHE